MPDPGERSGTLESDPDMLRRFRRGDRDVLATVFRLYVEDVAKTLRAGIVVDVDGRSVRVGARAAEPEVEVLVQETFVRAFAPEARDSYDGVRPFGAWLATIARNLVIDRARRRRREVRGQAALSAAELVEEPADPAWGVDEERLAVIVQAVRDALTGPALDVYRARFEEQQSLRETAATLGLSLMVVRRLDGSVRSRLWEAFCEAGFGTSAKAANPGWLRRRRKE